MGDVAISSLGKRSLAMTMRAMVCLKSYDL